VYAQRESSISRSSVKIVLAFTVLLVPMFSANAHGLYPAECCNGDGINGDCRPVSCSEIESIHDGWLWHGFKFTKQMRGDPIDEHCHVCVGSGGVAHCIFLPFKGPSS
jgi:hypothetical protein